MDREVVARQTKGRIWRERSIFTVYKMAEGGDNMIFSRGSSRRNDDSDPMGEDVAATSVLASIV